MQTEEKRERREKNRGEKRDKKEEKMRKICYSVAVLSLMVLIGFFFSLFAFSCMTRPPGHLRPHRKPGGSSSSTGG